MTSAGSGAPQVGDVFTWPMNPGSLIEVLSVGRKYAQIRVTQSSGVSWTKKQPLPFPLGFMRVTTPGQVHAPVGFGCACGWKPTPPDSATYYSQHRDHVASVTTPE